jgi:hypothetical protein
VRRLQELLAAAGFSPGVADGNFGASTHAAVLAFQRAKGLGPDGAVGPLTIARLTSAEQAGVQPGHASTALSLHVGLNRVNNQAYGFDVPELSGCVNDANDMQELALRKGFRVRPLLNEQATSEALMRGIREAADPITDRGHILAQLLGSRKSSSRSHGRRPTERDLGLLGPPVD